MSRQTLLAHIKERCLDFRAALLGAQLVPEAELAAVWPGGERNPGRDGLAWAYTHWNLARFMARQEARQEYASGPSASRSDHLIHLQQGTPRTVALARPVTIDGAEVQELRLHHKSFTSLRRLATYARLAAQLLTYVYELEQAPEHADLIIGAQAWRERILQMLIWGAVSSDAAGRTTGLPWDPATTPWPEPPEWLTSLDAIDVLAVQIAYAEMYGRSLLSVAPFIAPSDEEQDPLAGWETFFASYGTEKGIEAQHLMNDRAFLPFLTQVSLAAHASRQAREAAKAETSAAEVG